MVMDNTKIDMHLIKKKQRAYICKNHFALILELYWKNKKKCQL